MATSKTPASEGKPLRVRVPRMRTNLVAAETAYGDHHCLYIGLSADEALKTYARLREANGRFTSENGTEVQAVRSALILDPKTAKHSSFAV